MQRLTDDALKQLGGTTAVAELLKAPVSTVHSWKRSGISPSRLDHLKLAVRAEGREVDWDKALEPVPSAALSASIAACPTCDARPDSPQAQACDRSDCGLRQKEAA
jgi:hypothetical protein